MNARQRFDVIRCLRIEGHNRQNTRERRRRYLDLANRLELQASVNNKGKAKTNGKGKGKVKQK